MLILIINKNENFLTTGVTNVASLWSHATAPCRNWRKAWCWIRSLVLFTLISSVSHLLWYHQSHISSGIVSLYLFWYHQSHIYSDIISLTFRLISSVSHFLWYHQSHIYSDIISLTFILILVSHLLWYHQSHIYSDIINLTPLPEIWKCRGGIQGIKIHDGQYVSVCEKICTKQLMKGPQYIFLTWGVDTQPRLYLCIVVTLQVVQTWATL